MKYTLIAFAIAVPGVAAAGEASTFAEMVSEGSANLDVRYRFEYVDQDGFDEEAEAHTVRSRLSFTSATFHGLNLMLEFDDVSHIGDDDFNSTANGNGTFPVVADVEGTEANQAWIKYSNAGFAGTYGRQRVLHGSQRFVGGVGWRQNEQTYDGFRATWEGGPGIAVDYAYIYTVNRIFGPDDGPVQPAELDGDNHFLRASFKPAAEHSITAFAYLLDIDEEKDYPAGRSVGNSSDTFGLEYTGKFGPVTLDAMYATQEDAGDSPLSYDADFFMVQTKIKAGPVVALVGYEVLGADNGVGFKTPYATLHKFQGWADKFLVTPGDGIEDLYAGLTGSAGPVKLGAFYHDFQAEDSGADFGTELDLVATWPINKQWLVQLKYANFDSDDEARFSDTEKAWFIVNLKL
ncbi:MAG: porin [Halioglobus sp.]|nr:porin [Halioglobus sp.]